jgi:hypothetical protein
VVIEAINQWGGALQHASKKLQNDPELKKLAEDETMMGLVPQTY